MSSEDFGLSSIKSVGLHAPIDRDAYGERGGLDMFFVLVKAHELQDLLLNDSILN